MVTSQAASTHVCDRGCSHPATAATPRWRRLVSVDLRILRGAGLLMLAAGALLPFVPFYPGIACPLRTLTGIPCPFCGMSTSVKETIRLNLQDAFAANPAGVLAVLATIFLIFFRPARLYVPVNLIYVALFLMWLYELSRFSVV